MQFEDPVVSLKDSKLPDTGISIFTVMSQMASNHDALNLSQGFPDFEVSAELISLVEEAMRAGHNQYAPSPGLPSLRNSIGMELKGTYGWEGNPETEVTVTGGATEALYSVITAFTHSGDEVILFDPAYDSYDPVIRLNGSIPVHIELDDHDFSVNWEKVDTAISARTKMIIINSPHNPTGAILSPEDMRQLETIANKYDLLVLSDEVYHHIIFDNRTHESVLRYPGLLDRSIAVFSFGKTFHVTGWKIGYFAARANLTSEIRKVHQFLNFSVNTPMQHALAQYLKDENNYNKLGSFYQKKRDRFLELTESSRFAPVKSYGTYFQLLSYRNISELNEQEMAEKMTRESKVASIPMSVFYESGKNNHMLRFCFSKENETLEKAAEILCKI